jgi:Phosphoserine phosphatase RsbU, N-terminal domain
VRTGLDDFSGRYRAAFESYLRDAGERALREAYEFGRAAVAEELNVLDLVAVHHEALRQAAQAAPGDAERVIRRGEQFFLESLSSFEMVRRVLREAHEDALVEQRHAATLRRLSGFLGDASLALDAAGSLEELLQLVAEHALELIDAGWCKAQLKVEGMPAGVIEAFAPGERSDETPVRGSLAAPLTALDGRELGSILLFGPREGDFSDLDEAILAQLAQMASAAIERAQVYVGQVRSPSSPVESTGADSPSS